MNAHIHSQISVKNRGGHADDYYGLHKFIDCTKEVCSDNRHRILHTHWGISNVINPVIGERIINSEGKQVNVKDLCEYDHILPDYGNKFIPTLSDFAICIEESHLDNWKERIELLHLKYEGNKHIQQILLSPLRNTGLVKSLLFTHNNWFLYEILPKLTSVNTILEDCEIKASEVFSAMRFEMWMDNGSAYPPSAKKLERKK